MFTEKFKIIPSTPSTAFSAWLTVPSERKQNLFVFIVLTVIYFFLVNFESNDKISVMKQEVFISIINNES